METLVVKLVDCVKHRALHDFGCASKGTDLNERLSLPFDYSADGDPLDENDALDNEETDNEWTQTIKTEPEVPLICAMGTNSNTTSGHLFQQIDYGGKLPCSDTDKVVVSGSATLCRRVLIPDIMISDSQFTVNVPPLSDITEPIAQPLVKVNLASDENVRLNSSNSSQLNVDRSVEEFPSLALHYRSHAFDSSTGTREMETEDLVDHTTSHPSVIPRHVNITHDSNLTAIIKMETEDSMDCITESEDEAEDWMDCITEPEDEEFTVVDGQDSKRKSCQKILPQMSNHRYSLFPLSVIEKLLYVHHCPICDVNVDNVSDMWTHFSAIHSALKFCPEMTCQVTCISVEDMMSHISKRHLHLLKYSCPVCKERHSSLELARLHLNSHSKCCLMCRQEFEEYYLLQDHMCDCHSTSEINDNMACAFCFFQNADTELMIKHVAEHFGMVGEMCKFCNKWFTIKKEMYMHIKSAHRSSVSFQCPVCTSYQTKNTGTLVWHWNNGCSKWRCGDCRKYYASSDSAMRYHQLSGLCSKDRKERRLSCDKCPCRFANHNHLKRHVIVHHDKSAGMSCITQGCDFIASTRQQYEQHIYRQHNITDGVSAANMGLLKVDYNNKVLLVNKPVVKETKTKLIKCAFPACDFVEKNHGDEIKHHVASHHPPKKTFSKMHGRFGHGVKLGFICELCGLLCRDRHSVHKHQVNSHGKATEYECKQCSRYFVLESSLRKHNENVHRKNPRPRKAHQQTAIGLQQQYPQAKSSNHRRKPKHTIKPDKCPLCDYVPSVSNKNLVRHMLVHYRKGETIPEGYNVAIHKCPLCSYTGCEAGKVRRHLITHVNKGEELPAGYTVS